MSQGSCEVSPKDPQGRNRPTRRLIALLALAVAISACAAPISVTRRSPQTVHQELTRNVLSTGEPSLFSQIILNRADLAGRFEADPEAALRTLHTAVASGRGGMNELFALAELSFFHAERTHQHAYYLAATVYAYAFLFPPEGTASPEAHDPRSRLAYDLYNRALTDALRTPDDAQVDLRAAVLPLPFGEMELAFAPAQLTWIDRQLTDFVPVADLEVKGLRNRYRRAGIGAPLAASTVAGATRVGLEIPPRLKVPVTAFLRLAEPWQQLQATRLHATLELYVDFDAETVRVDDRDIPLEAEPTAAAAYMLSGSRAWDWEFSGFLFGELLRQESPTQLYAMEPYRYGRIPVVFVHGTASSPARWAEMLNELQNDIRLWQRYQFWSFVYETGNPVIYSAMRLRDALETVVATVDPDGRDPAMREMVLVGHSQGGLLVKLMAVDLEDQLRAEFLPVPIEELPVSAETRELIRRGTAVRPLPFVRRVIFLATPHRGSYVAGSWLAQQLSRLVRVPGQVLRLTREMLKDDPKLQAQLAAGLSSVQGMTPGSPLVTVLAPAPLAPWITGHSIIAVQGEGPREETTDGVVAYSSAHIDGMASELVVRSGHSVQGNPEAIEEVRRILLDQAGLQ